MIYVPNDSYSCYIVLDKDTIRAYESNPTRASDVNYVDYYVNSHYLSKTGIEHFGLTDTLPTCVSSQNITTDVSYRNDYNDVLITFTLLAILCFLLPTMLILRLFRKKGA